MTVTLTKPSSGDTNWASPVNANFTAIEGALGFYAGIISTTPISITAATTATANRMHTISGSSADYTITLPSSPSTGDVVGFTVLPYSSASKQYTLDAGAGVIIAGRTRYVVLVHTNTALFYWNGSQWLPLILQLDSPWINAGTMTIRATTTNPTKGTTSSDRVRWSRSGQNMVVSWEYYQTSAGSAGSGDYLFDLPMGCAFDSAQITPSTTSNPITDGATALGCGEYSGLSAVHYPGVIIPFASNSTSVKFFINADNTSTPACGLAGTSFIALSSTPIGFLVRASVPIVNW